MAKVVVYGFDFRDGLGEICRSPRAATLDRIERMNGHPVRETAIEVDSSEVDSNGFLRSMAGYRSPPPSWQQELRR